MRLGMKNIILLTTLLVPLWPVRSLADDQKPDANVNSKYEVESVEITGVAQSKVSQALRDDIQKLVGEKYSSEAADVLARRMRKELPNYSITVKAEKGDKPERLKVVFEAERNWWKRFDIKVPPVVYHSKEGLSGTLELPIDIGPNVFTFGFVNTADPLLERNAGFRFRYEHKKVGTDRLQLRLDFDTTHQMWNPATEAALAQVPDVPGVYRSRQTFAPSMSVIPFRDLKLTVGTSFDRFETQYPTTHTETAYAGTAGIQYRHNWESADGVRQRIRATYDLRTATRTLDSDFVYTRHFWSADYTLGRGRNQVGAHFQAGLETGRAPLFDRYSLGNSYTLRGWNKFDVAPLGGDRMAHGSLDYRFRPFEVFYDVGAVWDTGQKTRARHSLGFGLSFHNGGFVSLAFPVRLDHVAPVFMLGFRY